MNNKSTLPPDSIEDIINIYSDMLFRLCLITLKNSHDAEDAVQETFIAYLNKSPSFKDNEHQKAWLIKVATNKCKDILRYKNRHNELNIDDFNEFVRNPTDSDIINTLMSLPEKFRVVLVLYYVEGYNTKEIASIISKTQSAVKMRLKKGRLLLYESYRKEQY